MRPKFILALAVVTAAILLSAIYFKRPAGGEVMAPAAPKTVVPAAEPAPPTEKHAAELPVITLISNAPAATNVLLSPEERQAAIVAEIDRLHQLFMNDDPTSLPPILADLTNSEKEIRSAAIEATKQFGSTNAIPALMDAADHAGDLAEKIELLKAADFLTLPSMNVNGPHVDLTPEQIQAEAAKFNRRHPQPQNPPPATGH